MPNRLRRIASTRIPTALGVFRVIGFEMAASVGSRRVDTALAVVLGDLTADAPLLRIHSQCVTGEVLGSLRCDCGEQLQKAIDTIAREGRGLLIYEYQEGRGIGLMAKLQAYELQDTGLDTIEANQALGFAADSRDYRLPTAMLRYLGVNRVRLLSNNPNKARALFDAGIQVVARIPCEATPNPHSFSYLRAKKEKMGHALSLGRGDCANGDEGLDEGVEFSGIEEAVSQLRAGRMIVVVDDEERENEGDLMIAAQMVTPEAINFMATHGRGLICLAMTAPRLHELGLDQTFPANDDFATAFTPSIDLKGGGVTTGISAHDRAQTIRAAIDSSSQPNDFSRPGHVFPLRARTDGVLERRGHTEAAVDLARLAGLYPAGVICEVLNDDGTMARVPDLARFCRRHNLAMITIAELARYRLEYEFDEAPIASDGTAPPLGCSSLPDSVSASTK